MPTTHAAAATSPKDRHKFLCSHGGRILPRPSDAQLKYVGGHTRVISLPHPVPFHEVMKRLTYQIEGEMVLKYQLVSDELDTLVSVKSDEDVVHMLDEMEHYETDGRPRMRAFLFPSNNVIMTQNQVQHLPKDQRYIHSINTNQLASWPSSGYTSPDSSTAESVITDTTPHDSGTSPTISSIPQQTITHYGQFLHPQYYHNSGVAAAPVRLVSAMTAPSDQYFYASRQLTGQGSGCYTRCTMHHQDLCSGNPDTRMI